MQKREQKNAKETEVKFIKKIKSAMESSASNSETKNAAESRPVKMGAPCIPIGDA